MALKAILFVVLFVTCFFGAVWIPLLGVLGYVGHYSMGPERQWWHARLVGVGARYSFLLAIVTAVGMAVNWRRLRFGKKFLLGPEVLLLLLLGVVWLSVLIGGATSGRYTVTDHPSVKFTKVVIFALMLTHIVTDLKKLNGLLWVLVACVLVLGLQAYDVPRSAFSEGRLETVGGLDFAESNFLAAYLAALLPIIGIQFLHSKWPGKVLCLVAGVFGTNAIVLTRSRGALVGVGAGALVAAFLSPRKHKVKVIAGLVIFGLGGLRLADPQFIQRMRTISRSEDDRDRSAQSRIDLWRASGRMIAAHPMGVGAGNFNQNIGRYDSRLRGKSAHNTYFHCAAELGLQGIALFGLLVIGVFRSLRQTRRRADSLPEEYRARVVFLSYGMLVALVTLLACCVTISVTYLEFLWWIFLLPVCLSRVVDNIEEDPDRIPGADTTGLRTTREMARASKDARKTTRLRPPHPPLHGEVGHG